MPTGSRRSTVTLALRLVVIAAAWLALSACGDDETPEPTFEERLAELEGRTLTPVELASRAEVGELLCQFDDQLLDEIWQRLDEDQLDFHDIVVTSLCPERAILYAGHTGRVVTEEAELSGVRTSTTRPTSSTATTARPTTTPPAPTDPSSTDPSDDSTTATSTSTPTTSTSTTTSTSQAPSSATTSTSTQLTTSRAPGTTTIITTTTA